jgi:hypothetical protein
MALINDHELAVTREKLEKLRERMKRLEQTETEPFFYEMHKESLQALIDQLEQEIADYLQSKAAQPQPVEAS